jgi:hypothetical protein
VTEPPAGIVTVTGPSTGSRFTGPSTAVHACTVSGAAVAFVRMAVNSKLPPPGKMRMGGFTGTTETTSDAASPKA